ncbi:hypothetical protein FNH22_09515 [Fulvivirga sp. M361]|uniref:ComEA family DNA-binding protein n=1 Tax=Fulvivirga sp. M361 TaxID=2594266 RepID=UPI001179B1DB|nr:helix-hairpin-helix domain-containing protein [Fulvivirga sp. M361]TRX59395.1 hypothetical protein FNH22_09515 [Fulvivirga sp. M361]
MKKLIIWFKNSFGISTTEANGFVIFLILLLTMTAGIFWMKYAKPDTAYKMTDQKKMDSLLTVIRINAVLDNTEPLKPKKFRTYDAPKKRTNRKSFTSSIKKNYSKPQAKIQVFDINQADTTALKRLKGIGKVFSRRIVNYRNALGGFVSKKQFNEVYGLADSVILQLDTLTFISSGYHPKWIEINLFDDYDLSRHPYISKKVARAITAYRFQHGQFTSIEDLDTMHLIDSLTLARIEPYLKF